MRTLFLLVAIAFAALLSAPVAAQGKPSVLSLPAMHAWSGDLDGMVKRRMIRILVPISRTGFFLDKGATLGLDAELGRSLEKWINARHGKKTHKIHVGFIPTPPDRLLAELAAGKGDIAAGLLTITPERQTLVDFTAPLATGIREVAVTGPTASAIATLDDLGGKPMTVRRSASYFTHLVALNAGRQKAGKPPIDVKPADENLSDEDLLEMVGAGMLPWTVVDEFKAKLWAGLLRGLTVRSDLVINDGGQIAWAVRKNSPLLRRELDAFVAQHKIGTAFGNELKRRYLTQATTIRNALANDDADAMRKLLPAFKTYGARYAIDPLLIAAQGYQESGFDQSLKSRAGAVGVMQIKPSTAGQKPIEIADVVSRADDNIHAGAKYLRYLADTYIADPSITARDQVLMALAAYNAGPGNLRKFRAYATKHGLDSTRWFGHVETGAAAIVGQETVQYIGNIYKYYLSYSALELAGDRP